MPKRKRNQQQPETPKSVVKPVSVTEPEPEQPEPANEVQEDDPSEKAVIEELDHFFGNMVDFLKCKRCTTDLKEKMYSCTMSKKRFNICGRCYLANRTCFNCTKGGLTIRNLRLEQIYRACMEDIEDHILKNNPGQKLTTLN